MVSIEQVRLLESRVVKTIDFVDQVTEENALLKSKLESCQKRIDELEVLIQRFKEDQAKIEDGIVSALDRLNKFEDEMDKGISKAKSETASHQGGPSKQAHSVREALAAAAPAAHTASAAAGEITEVEEGAPQVSINEEGFVLKDKPYIPGGEEEADPLSSELDIF